MTCLISTANHKKSRRNHSYTSLLKLVLFITEQAQKITCCPSLNRKVSSDEPVLHNKYYTFSQLFPEQTPQSQLRTKSKVRRAVDN